MADIDPSESARRVRAALAYAGLELDEAEGKTGIPAGTLRGYTSKSRPRRASPEKRAIIAIACEIPPAFMEDGFDALSAISGDVPVLVAEHETRISGLEFQLARLRRRLESREGGQAQEHQS